MWQIKILVNRYEWNCTSETIKWSKPNVKNVKCKKKVKKCKKNCTEKFLVKRQRKKLKILNVWPMNILLKNDVKKFQVWHYKIGLNN